MRLWTKSFALNFLALVTLVVALLVVPIPVLAGGATQVMGIGSPPPAGECTGEPTADFATLLEGDIEGCQYVWVDFAKCSAGGTYLETGRELYVASYGGDEGTFRTTYRFTARFEDCETLANEIVGRCQHPIVADSGVGVFEGVSGRLDFKDDIEAGNFPYRGHLRW